MAKLGTLKAQILVDDPSRVHYGSDDSIIGTICLKYSAPGFNGLRRRADTATLWGPLSVQVVLAGRVRTKVRRGDSHRLPTDHSQNLFQYVQDVYKGTFKAELNDERNYPFTISLPRQPVSIYSPAGGGGYAELMADGRSRTLHPLTLSMLFTDHPDAVDTSISYRLGVLVNMPGIGIQAEVPVGTALPEMRFELPRPPEAVTRGNVSFTEQCKIQNEHLLPEDERPRSLKQKAKALYTSSHFPTFIMDVQCSYPKYIYPGRRLSFELTLRRNDASTVTAFPEVTLEKLSVELRACTIVDVSSRIIGPPKCINWETVQILSGQTRLSRQLSKKDDYTCSIETGPVKQFVSSFAHHKVSRQYALRFAISFTLMNESVKLKKECPVVLVPSPFDSGDSDLVVEAGPSRSYIRPPPVDDEELPAYGEPGAATLLRSDDDLVRPPSFDATPT